MSLLDLSPLLCRIVSHAVSPGCGGVGISDDIFKSRGKVKDQLKLAPVLVKVMLKTKILILCHA